MKIYKRREIIHRVGKMYAENNYQSFPLHFTLSTQYASVSRRFWSGWSPGLHSGVIRVGSVSCILILAIAFCVLVYFIRGILYEFCISFS